MTTRCRFAVLLMWLVLPVATASAHHSLSVEFDTDKTVTLTAPLRR
jgi:methionine-rich copper-binding protein CopC